MTREETNSQNTAKTSQMPLERACRSCTGKIITSGTKRLHGISERLEQTEIIPTVSGEIALSSNEAREIFGHYLDTTTAKVSEFSLNDIKHTITKYRTVKPNIEYY